MANPTVVTPIPDQTSEDLASVSLNVSSNFADADAGNTLTYSATGFPPGSALSLNTSTGVISGTPGAIDIDAAPYTVTVRATNLTGNYSEVQVTLNATGVSPGQALYTDVTLTPHSTTSATVYTTLAQIEAGVNALNGNSVVKKWTSGISNSPDDYIYTFVGDGTTSLVIDLSGDTGHKATHPMRFDNWLDVKVIGVYMDLPTLDQNYPYPTYEYPFPKIPGGMFMRFAVKQKIWVEGCHLKGDSGANALNGDHFVWRGTYMNGASPYTDYNASSFTLQNSKCEGVKGASCWDSSNCSATDTMYHTDLWQNQGSNPPSSDPVTYPKLIQMENVVSRNGSQQITVQSFGHTGTGNVRPSLWLRNCDFAIPDDYDNAITSRGTGLHGGYTTIWNESQALANTTFDNVTYQRRANWPVFIWYWENGAGKYLVDPDVASQSATYVAKSGLDFHTHETGKIVNEHVSDAFLGGNYVSPHAHDHL